MFAEERNTWIVLLSMAIVVGDAIPKYALSWLKPDNIGIQQSITEFIAFARLGHRLMYVFCSEIR